MTTTTDEAGSHRKGFFVCDLQLLKAMTEVGASFEQLAAYITLARFCNNRGEVLGTKSAAGVQAVQQYSGMSRARADAALRWLRTAVHPDTGTPFVLDANEQGRPRTAPRFNLHGVEQDRLVPLPNQLVARRTDEGGPSPGLLQRLSDSSRPIYVGGGFVATASEVRLAALLLLVQLYELLDIERLGGSTPEHFDFGSTSVSDYDDMQIVAVRLGANREPAFGREEHLRRAAHHVLRATGAVRLNLAVVDPDGEVAYVLAAFGPHPDWVPQACYRIRGKTYSPDDWAADGTWIGGGALEYAAPLLDGQRAVLVPCPGLLPLTPTLLVQTQSFRERTSRRIDDIVSDL
jgi:hypothetical protein